MLGRRAPHLRADAHGEAARSIDGQLDDPAGGAPSRPTRSPSTTPTRARPQRAHRGARPLRRRRTSTSASTASRSTRRSCGGSRAATGSSRRTASGSTSTAGATASAPSTSPSTPPACCPTASTSTTPTSPPTGTPSGRPRSPTPTHGYCVEFRIPLSVLRFSALPVQDWGFQVRRFIDARQETDDWAFFPRSAGNYVPLFGRLDDLRGLPPRRPLELRPFVLGRARHRARRRRTPTLDARVVGATASAGLDAKAHLTNELTLDLDGQPRLRPGRGRHRHPEPVDVRDVLPREAAVLPGGDRRLRDAPPAPLHAPHRRSSPRRRRWRSARRWSRRPSRRRSTARPSSSARSAARTTVGVMSAVTAPNDVADRQTASTRADATAGAADGLQRPAPQAQSGRQRRRRPAGDRDQPLRDAATRSAALPGDAASPAADGRCTNDAYVVSADGRWRSARATTRSPGRRSPARSSNGPAARRARRTAPSSPDVSARRIALRRQGRRRTLAVERLAAPRRAAARVQRPRLPRTQERLPGVTRRSPTGRCEPWWDTRETRTGLQLNVRETLDGLNLWRELRLATSGRSPTSGRSTSTSTCAPPTSTIARWATARRSSAPASAGISADFASDPRRP